MLLAGERGGSLRAAASFSASASAALYASSRTRTSSPPGPARRDYQPELGCKARPIAPMSPAEYLGVGYIIGPRVAGSMFAGGVFSWLVLMPADLLLRLAPHRTALSRHRPVTQMSPSELWSTYIRPMGAGAVAASGLITLIKLCPTIFSALTAGEGFEQGRGKLAAARQCAPSATCSMIVVVIGWQPLVMLMFFFLTFKPVPGAQRGRSPIWLRRCSSSSSDFSLSPSHRGSSVSSAAPRIRSPA